jgi:hypothetical protein
MENSTFTPTRETNSQKPWNKEWLERSWIVALHKRFSAIYLQKFTSAFPDDECFEEWAGNWGETLKGCTGAQIKYALDRVGKESVWPPSSVEFYQLCQAAKGPEPFPQLEPPKPLSDVGQAAMAKIREMLKQKPPSKAWAYKILKREKDGECLAAIAVKWAQEVVDADMGRKAGSTSASENEPTATAAAHA